MTWRKISFLMSLEVRCDWRYQVEIETLPQNVPLIEHRPHAFGLEGKIAQPLAGGVRECIGDGGNHRSLRCLAGS